MMFAQANPDPKAFLEFWIIIAFICGVAVNVVTLVVALVNRKQRREVNFGFVPASKDEFDKTTAELKAEDAKLHQRIGGVERGTLARCDARHDAADKQTRAELSGIHTRINDILSAVSRLSGQLEQSNREKTR